MNSAKSYGQNMTYADLWPKIVAVQQSKVCGCHICFLWVTKEWNLCPFSCFSFCSCSYSCSCSCGVSTLWHK